MHAASIISRELIYQKPNITAQPYNIAFIEDMFQRYNGPTTSYVVRRPRSGVVETLPTPESFVAANMVRNVGLKQNADGKWAVVEQQNRPQLSAGAAVLIAEPTGYEHPVLD